MLSIFQKAGLTLFHVRVQPRSGRTRILGLHGDALKVQLTAAPIDGRANQQLLEILSKALGVPRNHLTLTAGTKSRDKTVAVRGLSQQRLREILERLLTS